MNDMTKQLEIAVDDAIYKKAEKFAKRKLQLLILRYGDNNGVRRTPEYLAELITEALMSELLTETCQMSILQLH